jgi:hypothetical protein
VYSPEAIEAVKRAHPCDQVAAQWVTLRRRRTGQVGPWPICSVNPHSRTAVRFEAWADRWVCAVCQDGGDVLALVARRRGCSFAEAMEWLGGAVSQNSPREAWMAAWHAQAQATAAATAEHYRQKELTTLRDIWERAQPLPGSLPEAYLRIRGIGAAIEDVKLRCVPGMPYYHDRALLGRAAVMVGMIERDGVLQGLHLTYIDLDQPNGKAAFCDADGTLLPAKKCRGRVAGGHIALIGPPRPRRLILGEGYRDGAVGVAVPRGR